MIKHQIRESGLWFLWDQKCGYSLEFNSVELQELQFYAKRGIQIMCGADLQANWTLKVGGID